MCIKWFLKYKPSLKISGFHFISTSACFISRINPYLPLWCSQIWWQRINLRVITVKKIFGIECNWNNIDQFCKYAHQQTWKLKSTTLLVWGWFQYRGSKYQTVYHKKIIGILIIYTGMFICFFLEATFCTLQCCYLLILKKDLFIFITLVILFFLDQHALVPLTTGVYINSNRLLCA